MLVKRADKFLHKIMKKHKNNTVLFVCHCAIGRAFISVIVGKDFGELEQLHNTSVSIFEISEDKSHKIHLFNCKMHLE